MKDINFNSEIKQRVKNILETLDTSQDSQTNIGSEKMRDVISEMIASDIEVFIDEKIASTRWN